MDEDGDQLLEGLLGKRYLSQLASSSLQSENDSDDSSSFFNKVKQEHEDSDDEFSIETRKRRSKANDSVRSSKQARMNDTKEDEPWQSELRTILNEGEAKLEDYLSDHETSLKWIVKHGIRLAITCTKCDIIEHDDESENIQLHGLSCCQDEKANDSIDEEEIINYDDESDRINVSELPRPFYPDALQISLRKSLEKNSCKLLNLPGEMKDWPLKFIIGRNRKKRAGMCTFCGDIFLSIDVKKWAHECWMQDNEVNGFLINENEYDEFLDCPMDEAAKKNPGLLRFLINKTLTPETLAQENKVEKHITPMGRPRLNAVHDRSWAYSVRDRFSRGELKEKAIIKDPTYCIRYLIDSTGVVTANICINCMRIFSPSINSSNRSRHISVCYLSKNNMLGKQENGEELNKIPNTLFYKPTNFPKPIQLNDKNSVPRIKESNRMKRVDANSDYNINLEEPIIKAISTDLLSPEIFYQNGMKAFCDKLLKIGFEMGCQRGTSLPTFDELLPTLETTETNLKNLLNMNGFEEIFCYVSNVIKDVGGTIIVESIEAPNNNFVTISFSIVDGNEPKRLVYELLTDISKDSINDSIDKILTKMGIKSEMCNLFVNKQASELVKCENFALESSCFGDFLNYVVEEIFEESILAQLSAQDQQTLTDLKILIDKIPVWTDFLLSKCSIPTNARFILKSEIDGRWFSRAAWVEKVLILVKNYSEQILESISNLDENIPGKFEAIEFIEKAKGQVNSLQLYKKFVEIFITNLEPCAISRRSTIHLVVLKFQFIREQLKTLSDQQNDQLFRQFCILGVNIMESSEEKFLKKPHYLSTLLAPGHRDQLKLYYDEEQILDYENELIQTLNALHSNNSKENLESEIEKYFEADVKSKVDPFEWWSKNAEEAPRVQLFAKRLFSIPTVSTVIDKSLPQDISNVKIDEFTRSRLLWNWTSNSELQIKKSTEKSKEDN